MDEKSVEIIMGLLQHLQSGTLPVNQFPTNDYLDLINAVFRDYIRQKESEWEIYMATYGSLLKEAVSCENNSLLKELLHQVLEEGANPIALLEHKEYQQRIQEQVLLMTFRHKASEVYQKDVSASKEQNNAFQGKGVIYTVITGDYDVLHEPEYLLEDMDYICFTDNNNFHSSIWQFRKIENPENLDSIRLARKYKILCHHYLKEYDYSIYVDGKIKIIGNFKDFLQTYSKGSPMLCFPHFVRECIYQEAIACIQVGKDHPQIIAQQVKGYRQEGYPANYGLTDNACLIRDHKNRQLQKVMECWWNEVKEKSRRDQLSFGYACWRNQFHYDLCDLFIYDNVYICKRRDREPNY